MTIRYARNTSNKKTDNGTDDVTGRCSGEPDESLPDYQPASRLDRAIDNVADVRITNAAMCIAVSGSGSLAAEPPVASRGHSHRLTEHPGSVAATMPTDLLHRLLDGQIGLAQ